MTEADPQPPARFADTIIFPASLDPDAVNIVRRLNEAGLESYLVGGCVRDLLLGLIPKDFDISTEARPRQIRRLFRNSRIIGRRFKLAHIHFGSKIIEVATFRRTPEGSGEGGATPDLLITRDNEFGTAREDVLRRDFTINALLYDVRSAEVIDHVGGVQDLSTRTLRTIGEPDIRFAEDPVRMLRAIKFAARLGLSLDPEVEAAMHASAELIGKSAPPRVLEEIYKLLTCGAAGRGLPLLLQYGLFERLLPEVGAFWRDRPQELAAAGQALDLVDRGRRRLPNALLLAALTLRPWLEHSRAEPGVDPLLLTRELLDAAALRMSIPRRDTASAKHLMLAVLRLERPRRGRRSRGGELLSRSGAETLELLHFAARSDAVDPELHAHWVQNTLRAREALAAGEPREETSDAPVDETDDVSAAADRGNAAEGPRTGRRSRRRRRGGRRRRGRQGEPQEQAFGPQQQLEGDERPVGREAPGDAEGDADFDTEGTPREEWSSEGPEGGAAAGHPSEGAPQDGAPANDASADPRRRRRRGRRGGRRRRRGGGEAADALQAPRDGDSAADAHEAEERPAPRPEGGADADIDSARDDATGAAAAQEPQAPSTAGAPGERSGDRRGRRRRRGGRGRHQRDQRGSGPRQHERAPKEPRAPDTVRSDRAGGARATEPAGRGRGRRGPREPDSGPAQGPGQRHPEDVEDFFDW